MACLLQLLTELNSQSVPFCVPDDFSPIFRLLDKTLDQAFFGMHS